MTAVVALAVAVAVLAAPLVVAAVRQPSLTAMATRNLRRHRGETALVVAGAVLGTAIVTSAFVVGDILEGSIRDVARTQLGPIDLVVTPADASDLPAVEQAVDGAVGTAGSDTGLSGVDGLLAARTTDVAISALSSDIVVPRLTVMEVDVDQARDFGGESGLTGLTDVEAPGGGTIVLNVRAAEQLGVAAGDPVRVHAFGSAIDMTVGVVVEEVGLAGFAGAVVGPGTFEAAAASNASGEGPTRSTGVGEAFAPARAHLLVSLPGGVLDTTAQSDRALADVRAAVADIPGVEVDDRKATVLEAAERTGATFTQLFGTMGAFSVLAGILLLVNLFVMLAEERKSELGMLRALGFTRARLTRAFGIEGALYASVAAVVGAVLGIGVAWVVAIAAGSIFDIDQDGLVLRLVVAPGSLALGALTGAAMSLLTIWITSTRIARLNVIRAIRDLPEPRDDRPSLVTTVLSASGMVLGLAASGLGASGSVPILLLAGIPVAAFCAGPLLRRVLRARLARAVVALVVLAWGLAVFPLFSEVMGAVELPVFVVQGVVLTAGAVSLAATLDHLWIVVLERVTSRGRGLAVRLGLAYPLARPFRTSMLLGMFSLVVFTMAMLAAISTSMLAQQGELTDQARGGYDVLVDTNPANPIDSADLAARPDITAVASLARTFVSFDTDYVDEPREWPISGIDESILASTPPELAARSAGYATDADVYRAVIADPTLAIVDEAFLQDGAGGDRLHPGDNFVVVEPSTGQDRQLTAVATAPDWMFNGVLTSRTLTGELFGPQDVASRHYVTAADSVEGATLAQDLDADLLANGGDAETFATVVGRALAQQTALFTLLQAFLALGLIVGIVGLGVVMVRAVRERRQQVGMLRALGLPRRVVRSAFLFEAGLIALQGTAIGTLLGLITARQLMTSSEAFGDTELAFTVPWIALGVIVLAPIVAALLAAAVPAARAAAVRPAVAIRAVD